MPVLERSFEIYYDELHHTKRGCEVLGAAIARQLVEGAREARPTAPVRSSR
jgi:hypothetical protein